MATPLIPQEIYLLERYSSLDYFRPMRDQWEAMVKHVERCLDLFMEKLPPDYRRRDLAYQPDIVWGERVLPNFRDTLQVLYRAYISLSHGDLLSLVAANGVLNDFNGQREFSAGWMDEAQVAATISNAQDAYWQLISEPQERASNIARTNSRTWSPGALANRYSASARGPLDPPDRWPLYRLNPQFRVVEGGKVPRSGVYLPDANNSCAAVLAEGDDWLDCKVLLRIEDMFDPDGNKYGETPITEWRSTSWTLIERVSGETIPFEKGVGPVEAPPPRIPAGQLCPRSGWWYTPAKAHSRRHFAQGEPLPRIEGSDYGETFWLWSQDQSDPKL